MESHKIPWFQITNQISSFIYMTYDDLPIQNGDSSSARQA